jgi:hypothetical protein
MRHSQNDYKRLVSELEGDLRAIEELFEKNRRMTIDVSDLRPSLFPIEYSRRMDELRRFRHAFRNVYLDELDPRRLEILNSDIPALVADFRPFHSMPGLSRHCPASRPRSVGGSHRACFGRPFIVT